MVDQSFGMADADFWSEPRKGDDAVTETVSSKNYSGVLLGAPAKAMLDLRTTLPVVVIRCGSYRDVATVDLATYGLLVGVDLTANRTFAMPLFEQEDASGPGPDPNLAPKGYTATSYVFDARELLRLKWTPGRVMLTVVMRELLSNRATVELKQSERTYQDPEVAKFLESKLQAPPLPSVYPPPGDPLPSYEKLDDSPEIPAEPGVKVAIDRVVVLDEQAKCIVRGAFRLKARPHELVPPPKPDDPPPEAGAPPQPSAVVNISLLLIGSEQPLPAQLDLKVPSYDVIGPDSKEPEISGYFAFDLLAIKGVTRIPQTVFTYVLSGETLEGPIPYALISPAMLPK